MFQALSLQRIQIRLLVPAIFLTIMSIATLYTVNILYFEQQSTFLIVSIIAYLLFLNVDYRFFGIFAKQIYIAILVLLFAVFLIGFEAKGAVRWVQIFGVTIQFSEVLKPFFIIVFAQFLARNDSHDFKKFIISLILLAPVFVLVLRQPDLGNAIIYGIVALCMMVAYGFPFKYFLGLGILVTIPMPFVFNFLHDYQKERVFSFLNATSDPFGSSYNAIQALISVGSGGFFGKGFGQGTQSVLYFLPERHTDFIFATMTESIGFIGAAILLLTFWFLLFQIYKVSMSTKDMLSYLIVMGIFFMLLSHAFFNVGMNIGIVPIVGITLPYVSSGGSSLLTNFIALSIVSNIAFDQKKSGIFEIS